jgi:hypothetical protein
MEITSEFIYLIGKIVVLNICISECLKYGPEGTEVAVISRLH